MTTMTSGWDVGGAHIKVARCDQYGQVFKVIQVACPLWQGIDKLDQAIESIFDQLGNRDDHTAITMTGELVDIFPNRQAGVKAILERLSHYIPPERIHVYAAELGWLSPENAEQHWQHIASRNWQASATLVAASIPDGLFIDIGSTTCDIIPLIGGIALTQAFDDFGRQTCRELLYTGAIRTPLIAIAQTAPFNGHLVSLAAEVFATSGDVWCLLGELDPESILDISADGQPWTYSACASRIARLLGTDASEIDQSSWIHLAQWFAEQQSHQITEALLQVLSAQPTFPPNAPLIGAGVGRFIVKECAQRLNRPYHEFHNVISSTDSHASDHAPAIAVALLAQLKLP